MQIETEPRTDTGVSARDNITTGSIDAAIDRANTPKNLGRLKIQDTRVGAGAIGALATGALAIGAFAIGSLAIGNLVIGRLLARNVRIKKLRIEEIEVDRLKIHERGKPGFETIPSA